jgi:ferredoxin
LKVAVDKDLCIGLGNCAAIAPTAFDLDDDGKVVILDPSSVDEQTLLAAAQSCSVKAIIISDDKGNQLYP